ncbi:signal transduction histidine kinase [Geobacter argillaceus]|uniref:Signal transduction histidine kinase n=1 Tax=Geobacter argillaceus TaxID=345631 RepID=A0A562VG99_9BACT|nr:signal transduction histidine kinase [Geobacter argillaceus]
MGFMYLLTRIRNTFTAAGRQGAFLANLLIGGAIAFFVYFIQQTGLIELLLNRILYLLLLAIGTVIRYKQFHSLSLSGLLVDAVIIFLAAGCWTYLKTVPARILYNGLLLLALIPLTFVLSNRYGIFSSGLPIVIGILVAILLDATNDLAKNRFRQRIAEEKQEAEYSIVRHLAHNVKPSLQIVRSPLVALQGLMAERGLMDVELSRRLDGSRETVGEALVNAIASLGQINGIIDNTRKLVTREINREEFGEVELKELLEKEVFPLHSGGKFHLVVEGAAVRLRLHRDSFIEAVNNLLRNADVHGFPAYCPNAEVRFLLRQTRKNVVIDYVNNGRPFPANLSTEEFLSFGRKSVESPGEGLGGAWVGKVIEAHGGKFEIVRDGEPVHFRITLPKRGN